MFTEAASLESRLVAGGMTDSYQEAAQLTLHSDHCDRCEAPCFP